MRSTTSSVFGDMFDRVVVVNLSRRPDRMSTLRRQLDMLGVAHTRFDAVDGRMPDVAADWRAYAAGAIVTPPPVGQVTSYREFYLGDRTRQARVAFFEAQQGGKAIASAGAWGLFHSMKAVLEQAVADRLDTVLILEDDVLFHRDTVELWPRMRAELPEDWRILQLGAMQLHWEDTWIDGHSDHLYRCNGSSLAAHAFALRGDTIAETLAACASADLPFDIGALQEVKRRHRAQCFTCYPNLAIQDAGDTEIGMSRIFFEESRKEDNRYRWRWSDYGPDRLRPFTGDLAPHEPAGAPPEAAAPELEIGSLSEADARIYYLHPYGRQCLHAPRVVVLVSETAEAPADGHLDLLARQRDRATAAPIVVIEDLGLVPRLRARRLAFEYVPPLADYARRLGGALEAEVAVMRRLALLRRKWTPSTILSFGEAAHARLEFWRASPFEAGAPGPDLDPDYEDPDSASAAAP